MGRPGLEKHGCFLPEIAPLLSGLFVVLQLSPIHFNGAKLQYQTQPMDGCCVVFGKKQPYYFKSWTTPVSASASSDFQCSAAILGHRPCREPQCSRIHMNGAVLQFPAHPLCRRTELSEPTQKNSLSTQISGKVRFAANHCC